MKLNYDCIRDVLLFLEETLTIDDDMTFSHITSTDITSNEYLTSFYSPQDIYYAIYNLYQCDYIEAISFSADDVTHFSIYNISFEGHEFISHIRDNTFWKKLKAMLTDIKIENIPMIISIAQKLANHDFNL